MTIKEAFEQLDALRVANALGLEYGVVCKWRDRAASASDRPCFCFGAAV